MQRTRAALALAVLAILLAAPLAAPLAHAASGGTVLEAHVQTYEGTITYTAVNQTVVLAANASYTLAIQPPGNTSLGDWDYAIIMVEGNGTVQLEARLNGSTVYEGAVTPLSTGPAAVTIPVSDEVTVLASQAWSGTITVVLAASVEFEVALEAEQVRLYEPGDEERVQYTVKQTSGPPVFAWWVIDNPVEEYLWAEDDMGVAYTDGEGWQRQGAFTFRLNEMPEQEQRVNIRIYLYYDYDFGEEGAGGYLAAVVSLDGTLSPEGFAAGTTSGGKLAALGIGAVVGLVLAMVFLAGGRAGRQGTAGPMAPFIILVALAALAFAAGLLDVDYEINVDYKYLGIGFLAVLALVMLIRQGAVPAPESVQKLFK